MAEESRSSRWCWETCVDILECEGAHAWSAVERNCREPHSGGETLTREYRERDNSVVIKYTYEGNGEPSESTEKVGLDASRGLGGDGTLPVGLIVEDGS